MEIGIDCSRSRFHRTPGPRFELPAPYRGLDACCRQSRYLNCFKKAKEACTMKKLTGFSAGMCLVFMGLVTGLGVAAAQEMPGPPKVLVIQRELLKPGRAGATHLKTESAFVQAMTAAKWPTHYFAAESQSGESRAIFLIGYPS